MNDTSPQMEKMLLDLYMQRSGAERVQMACSLFTTARKLMTANLEAQGYTGDALRKQIFLRTYRNDYSQLELDKICQKLFDENADI
jgi:hypothetical protein